MSFNKHIYLYSQHTNQNIGHFNHPRKFPHSIVQSLHPHPTTGIVLFYIPVYQFCLFRPLCTGILQYVLFHIWPLQFFSFVRFINVQCYQQFILFYCCVVFHCMNEFHINGHLSFFLVWFIITQAIKTFFYFFY